MITTQLPAGLTGKDAEMYSDNGVLMALTEGISLPVVESARLRSKIFRHMSDRPSAHASIREWVGENIDDQINRYGQCLWGSFNMIPDINTDGTLSNPELVQCAFRGRCEYEGKVCQCIKVDSVSIISKAEERILPYILWADRIIGEILCLSEFTVTAHIRNIKKKLNIQTKAELVDWANQNGIKLCK